MFLAKESSSLELVNIQKEPRFLHAKLAHVCQAHKSLLNRG